MNHKGIELFEITPVIEEVLGSGGAVSFVSSGSSMMPLIGNKRDKITLVKCSGKLKKNDIPLYRRENGSFVLHRIIGEDENGYITRGDNQWFVERGVRDSQVIAVLKGVQRKGKYIDCDSEKHKLYCLFLPLIRWIRRIYFGALHRLHIKY
ncbi:MAG TPA: S24/S26 family peptidase [Clostridia bacterium]|nr:S24/S26 family peptidase [Clostridia bacterium]